MKRTVVFAVVALSCAMASLAHAFVHPCIPNTLDELATLKASLNQEPWKSGYAILAADGHSQLTYTMQGPFATVTRSPDLNLGQWDSDMIAVYNLSRMWYFTGNTAYAQKAHDILIAWANTETNFGGSEGGLELGDYAQDFAGGADILRGTWPGWTSADTTTVQNYFLNVLWPPSGASGNITGPANKGYLYMQTGIAIAVFCDDTNKFNQVINNYRTLPSSGLPNTLPTGETGETGRDEGHVYTGILGAAFISEVAWKQGVDLYSELNNRLLAWGEYYARNTLVLDNPFVPFGTTDFDYYTNNAYFFAANRSALYIIQNAYKNRLGLPTPWIDVRLQQQPLDSDNWMYAKSADFTTATPLTPIVRPAVSVASSGLTLTTLGTNTTGRSDSYTNGVWTMTGLGIDVWNDVNDDCQFAYQTMTGDCAMVARVTSSQYVTGSTKAGLMIRDNLSATVSQRAWIAINPQSTNCYMQCRQKGWTENWGGSTWAVRSDVLPTGMPYWLKVERRGNLITTYTSQDGTSWAANVSSYYANLPSSVYIGSFICSGSTNTTNTTTATFDHVAFTGGSGGLVTTPAAPATLFSSGSSHAVTVRWLPSFGATSYNLLRSTTSGSGYAAIASNLSTNTTSYVDTSAVAGTTYYYVAQAANSAGTSGNSPQFGASLLPAPLVNLAFGRTSTASAGSGPGLQNSDSVFDGNPGSKWYVSWVQPSWIQYDFGSNNAQLVKCYTITSADVAARDPKSWSFLGSQDSTNWTTLDSQSGQLFANRMQQNTYNIANTNSYRYYQLNITANNGTNVLAIAELGLWGDTGQTIPDGTNCVVNRNSNKLLDLASGSITNGTGVVQWSSTGATSQKWAMTYLGNGQYQAVNVASSTLLDVKGASKANGAGLDIWPSTNGNNQKWTISPAGDGTFKILNVNSGLAANVTGFSTADGAGIIQWPYNGSSNSRWIFSLSQ